MKKQYFVHRYNNFGNTYNLYWADSPEMIAALPEDAERISRKEAIRLCREERYRRKHDPSFSGYATDTIFPADYPDDQDIRSDKRFYLVDGFIWDKV